MKKKCTIIFILICLFSVKIEFANAYDFINPNNEDFIREQINQIYDAKEQYEDLAGSSEVMEITVYDAGSTSYWWPIGSAETTTINGQEFASGDPEVVYMSSKYGYRQDPLGRGIRLHTGIDIAGGVMGKVNIIAARDGVVVYPTEGVSNNCPSSYSLSSCGNGYGNYVIIQHSDGNYTLYAHLHQNSVTVKAGDSVRQGQVIGKMGSSGNSTGNHLHFEVREGANSYKNCVDPLNYVSTDNPRTVSYGDDFLKWMNSWEGHTPIEGDYYVVQNIGDGLRSVGSGITLENTAKYFTAYGIDVTNYPVGSKILISIVDSVELEVIADLRSTIENTLANNSITLQENQIQALVAHKYNTGNINGFVKAYKEYGNTQDLYDNWFYRCVRKGSQFEKGLTRRRITEWTLFHTGEYTYNG